MKTIRAIVVDDHPLMAQATKSILERMERIQVVGVANDGNTCMEMVETLRPDLIMLDYQLPDRSCADTMERIREILPQAHVVVFTGMDVSDLLHPLLGFRVNGIISKETSETTLKHMLHCILDDHVVLPHDIFYKIKLPAVTAPKLSNLSEDELLIMTMVVKGATYEQIADTIHVSKRSIDNYLRKIYDKLGVQNRIQAIEKFVQSGAYRAGEPEGNV